MTMVMIMMMVLEHYALTLHLRRSASTGVSTKNEDALFCFGNLIRTLYCSLFALWRPVVHEVFTKATFKIFNVM